MAPTGSIPISSSPRRRQRPALPVLSTSASSPQLRRLAELATIPSPSFSVASTLLPSPMSDTTVVAEADVVTPGEAITVEEQSAKGRAAEGESGLASRWSLDSVASRPRIIQASLDDASSSPASKSRKRDRFLSLLSGRGRSGSLAKPFPPPNTPRGSSDVLDIRRIDSPDNSTTSSRPSLSMTPSPMAPSLSSSNSSNGSTVSMLATPIEPLHDFSDPFAADSPSCVPDDVEEESLVFAANPYIHPDSPLLSAEQPAAPPSPPTIQEPLTLQIPERPMSPGSPPQPTLPLPSPSTPSPSFLVPSPRPQSFFASITGRQRRRKKKLVISGAPLELGQSRSSSSMSPTSPLEDLQQRRLEQQRRVQNVVKWCESFGAVRKIETRDDGSLHVYWKDWEVADMVRSIVVENCLGAYTVPARVGLPRSGAGCHQRRRPRQPSMVLHLMNTCDPRCTLDLDFALPPSLPRKQPISAACPDSPPLPYAHYHTQTTLQHAYTHHTSRSLTIRILVILHRHSFGFLLSSGIMH